MLAIETTYLGLWFELWLQCNTDLAGRLAMEIVLSNEKQHHFLTNIIWHLYIAVN